MTETMVTQETQVTQEVVDYLRQVRYIATRQASRRYPAECRISFRDGTGDWVDVPYAIGRLLIDVAVNATRRVGYVDWPARNGDERYANWHVMSVYAQRVADAVPVQLAYMLEVGRFDFAVWEARLCPYCKRPLIWCTCDYLAELDDYDATVDAASYRSQ